MSNTNNDTSDIKKAAEHADSQKIAQNLQDNKAVDAPEVLSKTSRPLLLKMICVQINSMPHKCLNEHILNTDVRDAL
jgi:hypothetical protein